MINMVSEGIWQALSKAPVNDENVNVTSENNSMRAELDDLMLVSKLGETCLHVNLKIILFLFID